MRKIAVVLIILEVLLALVASSYLVYSLYFSKPSSVSNLPNPGNTNPPAVKRTVSEDNFTAQISDINSLLRAIGVAALHNPPLSGEKPSIEIIIEERSFCSDVSDGKIQTLLSDCSSEDLLISTSNKEVAKMINSNSLIEAFKLSLSEGKTSFEMKASQIKLFSKGYLDLYNKVTAQD